jgi:4-carboxymuconolactone decarboxylase
MLEKNDDMKALSQRERELTAIGAAIVSNCVPCIEYHIPQARKVGLSDSQIREAVKLADKVRKVPAEKVHQTAAALLDAKRPAELKTEDIPCGCPETDVDSEVSAACGTGTPNMDRVQLDNRSSKVDNEMKNKSCNDRPEDTASACGSEKTTDGQQNAADQTGFDCSKMMEKCCPEKIKDSSAMMGGFSGGCCSSKDERRSEATETNRTVS